MTIKVNKRLISGVLFGLLSVSLQVQAITADEIAHQVDIRDTGDNSKFDMKMTLIDKRGHQRQRTMLNYSRKRGDDDLKLLFFQTPADVRNTGFLTFDYDGERDDDQWLYLPALKKTKRIASSDKSGSFMGSDFSYSDMTSRNIEDYNYKLVKEQEVGGHKVWVMESVPKTKKIVDETGYKKSWMFVRQDNFVVVRALHITSEGNKKKYMDVKKLEQIDGIWVATEIEMKTMKGKERLHTTVLSLSNIKFNQDLSESYFSIRTLEKGL